MGISGCAENSIFSSYLYLFENASCYNIVSENNAPKIQMVQGKPKELESKSMEFLTNDPDVGCKASRLYSTRTYEYLVKVANSVKAWLVDYGVVTISSFPEDLIKNDGSQVYDLLNFLLKNPPAKPASEPSAKKSEQVLAQVEQYTTLLNFLKLHGAAVNNIRPHYLLSYKSLLAYFKQKTQAHVIAQYYKPSEPQFRAMSLWSWLNIFLQILKLFFVGRLTSKQLRANLASYPESRNLVIEAGLDKNALYSASELILLKWAEYFLRKEGHEYALTNFDKDFSNTLAISCLVENYLQIRGEILTKGRPGLLGDDFVPIFDRLSRKLVEYGVKDGLLEDDFLTSNPLNMVLLLTHLFKTLPFYIPRATIDFKCALHESITKEITFSSPVNKTIIYTVRLHAHKNFSITSDTLKIDAKAPAAFPVTFYANTSLPATGKIIFQNLKNGKSIAGAVVFDLRAEVVSRFSMRTFNITTVNLYELGCFDVQVENPFDKDVDFKITVEHVAPLELREPAPERTVTRKNQTKKELAEIEALKRAPSVQIPTFFAKYDRIQIKKNSSAKLVFYYLPLTYEIHKANVVFLDTRVGEIQYDIVGKPLLPNALDSFKFNLSIENFTHIEVPIAPKNLFFT